MSAGGDLPHDLFHFVIESELGIRYGFWGCVAAGATFRTTGRKRTPQGIAVIRAHARELDESEARVNDAYARWRRGEPTPPGAALDRALAAWRRLGEGEELVLEWNGRSVGPRPGSEARPAGRRR